MLNPTEVDEICHEHERDVNTFSDKLKQLLTVESEIEQNVVV